MIYNSFEEYVKSFVILQKGANPNHKRLDGKDSGGNREIAGLFRFNDKVWKVHADTHYEPLLIAYNAKTKTPFTETSTNTGKGKSLLLIDELQREMSKPKFKHLYIYEYAQK